MAYELSSADSTRDVALKIRNEIKNAFESTDTLQRPITAKNLDISNSMLYDEVSKFLHVLLVGDGNVNVSGRASRLVQSIGQDMCRTVTNGTWNLPNHVLLCLTLHHMFCSAELLTLINSFGHCENYSFSPELETALATVIKESSNLLTPQIVQNPEGESTFHSDFDNIYQLTATGSVMTAHGIML